jgi:hypothetical protein
LNKFNMFFAKLDRVTTHLEVSRWFDVATFYSYLPQQTKLQFFMWFFWGQEFNQFIIGIPAIL